MRVRGLACLFYLSLILIFWSVCGSYMNLISCRWRIGGKVRNFTPFSASCNTNKRPIDIDTLTLTVYINGYVKSFNALQPDILFIVPACLPCQHWVSMPQDLILDPICMLFIVLFQMLQEMETLNAIRNATFPACRPDYLVFCKSVSLTT